MKSVKMTANKEECDIFYYSHTESVVEDVWNRVKARALVLSKKTGLPVIICDQDGIGMEECEA